MREREMQLWTKVKSRLAESRQLSLEAQRKRRAGSTVVLIALSFTALCGCAAIAVDFGQLVWTRNRLQRACDAAALAGASQLPAASPAMEVAGKVAGQNGVPNPAYSWPDGLKKIRVSASQRVQFGLARILGFSSQVVRASAIAGRVPLSGIPNNVPLAITTTDYNTFRPQPTDTTPFYSGGTSFELRLIDNNRQNFDPGTVTGLDLRTDNSGKSGNIFETDLTYGYFRTLYLNEKINSTLNASLTSQGGKLGNAMTIRFNDAAAAGDTGTNYTYPNYPRDSRRIVTLIVAEPNPADNNNPQVTAVRIVPVYIEALRSHGGDTFLRMRILPALLYSSDDPGVVVGDSNTPDNGPSVVQLQD